MASIQKIIIDHNPILSIFNKLFPKLTIFADLTNYLKELLFPINDPILKKLLFLIGTTTLTYQTISIIYKIIKSWKWVPKNFYHQITFSGSKMKERYGDCYVCITGFTEGIGRGYAEIFA